MKTKRILSLFLTVTMLMGMIVFPSTSAVATTSYTADQIAAGMNAFPGAIFWGDSLTYGTASGDFVKKFQANMSKNLFGGGTIPTGVAGLNPKIVNRGQGGNSMAQIVARSGAVPFTVSGKIETSGSSKLNFSPTAFGTQTTWYNSTSARLITGADNAEHTTTAQGVVPVVIQSGGDRITGVYNFTSNVYTLGDGTSIASGSFVPDTYPTYPISFSGAKLTLADSYERSQSGFIPVIYMGTNENVGDLTTNVTNVTNYQYQVNKILDYYGINRSTGKYVVVFPEFKKSTTDDETNRTALDSLRQTVLSYYGDHVVDLYSEMGKAYFDTDNIHYTSDGYQKVADLVYAKFDSLGYFDGLKTARGSGTTPTHQHSYSGYTYNETQHWQKCTGCEETTAKVNHTFVGGVCVCGAVEPAAPQSDTIIWNFDRKQTITDANEPSWLDTTTKPLTTKKYTASTKPAVDYNGFDVFSASDIGAYAVHNLWFDVATADSTQVNAGGNGHSYINPFYYQHWANADATSSTVLNDNYKSYIIYKVTPSSGAVLDKVSVKLKGYAGNGAGKAVNVYVTTTDPGQSSVPAVSGMTALKTYANGGTQLAYGTWSSAVDANLTNATAAYVIIELHCVSGNATDAMKTGKCYSKWSVGGVINPLISAIEIDRTQHVTHTHDYVAQDGQAATCTDAGYYGYKECQNDGCTVKYIDLDGNAIGDAVALATWKTTGAGKIAALGHQLDSGVEQTAATCITGGVTRYSCTRDNCEYYEDENTDPLGHQIDENAWENDETNHWHVCTRLGCSEPIVGTATHTFGGNPCGGSQCTACGYQVEAGSHTLVYHPAVTGDYDTTGRCEGNVEYWQCSVCGAYFLDEDATQSTTKAGVTSGSHTWEKAYTYNVANHWIKCSKCGKVKDSTVPHSYGAYTSDATTHSRTCTVCNYTETYAHKPAGQCSSTSATSCSKCGKTGISAGHDYVNGYCSKCGATDYAYNPENQGHIHVDDDILIHKNPEISNIYNVGNATSAVGYFSGNKPNNVFNANTIVRSCIDVKTGNLFIKNSAGTSGDSDGKIKTVEGSAVSKGYVSDMDKFAVYDAHHVFVDSSSANESLENYSDESMVYLTTCDTRMWHNANEAYSMRAYKKEDHSAYGQNDYGVSLFDESTWTADNKVDFAYVTYKVKTTDGSKLKDLYFTPYGRIAVNNNIQIGFMLTKDPVTDAAYVNNYENSSSTDKACVLNGFHFDDFVCILSNEYYTNNAPSSCNLDGKVSVLKTADGDDTRVALYQKYSDSMTHLPVADGSANLNNRTSFDFYGRGKNDRLDLDLSEAVAEMDTDTAYITVVLLTPGNSINIANGKQRLSGYQTHTAIRITGFDINPPEAYQVNIDKYDTYYMGANVSLAEEVKMNFYASFGTEDFERVQNGDWNVQITAGNEGNKNYKMVKVTGTDVCDSDLKYVGNDKNGNTAVNTYKFTVSVPAKMMSDKLTFKVIDTKSGLAVIDEEYSIKEYCADVKAAYGKSSPTSGYTIDALEEVVNAMLDYGTAAQQYLGYHTDNLANDGNWVAGIDEVYPSFSEGLTNSTGVCDIKLAAGNINLEENIHLRLCLAYTNGTKNNRDAYTVKLAYRAENKGDEWIEYSTDAAENSGKKLVEYPFPDSDATPTKYNDRSELYYFYIPLMAKQMDDVVRIQVWKDGVCILERYYSINMYCYSMYITSNINIKNATRVDHYEKLKKLCQATYSYGQEAQKYAQYGL